MQMHLSAIDTNAATTAASTSRLMRPVTPGSADSAKVLTEATAFAALEKRKYQQQQHYHKSNRKKSVMYMLSNRSGSSNVRPNRAPVETTNGQQTEVVKPSQQPAKSSKRNLRLSLPNHKELITSSSTSLSSSTTISSGASTNNYFVPATSYKDKMDCCVKCSKRWHELHQHINNLELKLKLQAVHTRELEHKLVELHKLMATLNERNKPKPVATKLVGWVNLSNWFKSRPSIETLKQQNIYNDEPCFDTEIQFVMKHEQHKTVPRIVVDCCDLIEEKFRHSTTPVEGIYRQCGDYNKIQTLRFKIDANEYESLRQTNVDLHTLTGLLKLFLREIKSPLISTNEAKTFIGKPNQWLLTKLNAKVDALKRLIRSLPEINRDTLDYLFAHFNRLTKVPLQHISAETLSISVAPSIFHTVPQGANQQDFQELLRETEMLADCIKLLIEYHHTIFECYADRKFRQRLTVRQLRKTLSQPDLFHNLF